MSQLGRGVLVCAPAELVSLLTAKPADCVHLPNAAPLQPEVEIDEMAVELVKNKKW
jgi:hypothetical protein